MTDVILIAVLFLVIGAAVGYIVRAKKRGVKCIGCPHGETCGKQGKAGGCCGNCSHCNAAGTCNSCKSFAGDAKKETKDNACSGR